MKMSNNKIFSESGRASRGVWAGLLCWLVITVMPQAAGAAPVTIEEINISPAGEGAVQIQLRMSGPAPDPTTFTLDNPARLAVDLPNTQIGEVSPSQVLDTGVTRNLRLVEADSRTRMIVGLTRVVPYEIRTRDNLIYINLEGLASASPTPEVADGQVVPGAAGNEITKVDFRRTPDGQGRVVIELSDPSVIVDSQTRAGKIVIDFLNTQVPERLQRRLDVTDFATPVTTIDTYQRDGTARVVITPAGFYEQLAYQIGETYTVDVKEISEAEREAAQRGDGDFTGEKLSLNFQNIEVRAVLQLIADFTGLNIVASDTVQGNITLRLKNVPWDQALDIVLKAKGLGMRKSGNVVMVAPAEEIAAREKQELEARQQLEVLAPLYTEFYQINYAKAADIGALIKADQNSLLSERGSVTVDERTNTLMILDVREKLEEIQKVVTQLDVPVRQVLIESRIVVANDDFAKNLGVRFGVTNINEVDGNLVFNSGTIRATDTMAGSAMDNLADTGQPFPIDIPTGSGGLNDRLNVNLPVAGSAGNLALAILGADYLVDLELSALQQEGKGEVVSNPRVITSNQKEALIEQGVEVPYQEASSSGATTTSFKKAVLSLSVTPQITPDDRVIMDLQVNRDSVGVVVGGIPTINTREVSTQVLVNNGDTVVLGGVYEHTRNRSVEKVPLLGDIPLLGTLFRRTQTTNNKAELLVFVTPKILKEGLRAELD